MQEEINHRVKKPIGRSLVELIYLCRRRKPKPRHTHVIIVFFFSPPQTAILRYHHSPFRVALFFNSGKKRFFTTPSILSSKYVVLVQITYFEKWEKFFARPPVICHFLPTTVPPSRPPTSLLMLSVIFASTTLLPQFLLKFSHMQLGPTIN